MGVRISILIICVGVVIVALGIIFHFQGYGIVGPESSFMYKNPEWIGNGQKIAIIGIVATVIGIALKIKKV